MPASALIGNLAVNLTMETAAFQRGATIAEKRAEGMRGKFTKLTGSMKLFAAGFAGGIAASVIPAITGLVSKAFEMASSLQEAAQKVGVTVEALQELRYGAAQAGVSNEQLDAALIRLSKSMGGLQLKDKAITEAFKRIGLSADELRGKSPDQALRLIADGLNTIPDAATRVAIGQQIMGKGFAQLIPLIAGGSAELEKYAEASRKSGQISTEDAKKLDELADSWERMKTKALVAVAGIVANAARIDEFIFKWYELRDRAIESVSRMAASVVASVNNMVSAIGQAITGRLNAIWEGAKAKVDSVAAKFRWLYDAVIGNSYVPDMVDGIAVQMARLDAVLVKPVTAAVTKTAEAFRALQQETLGLLERLFPESADLNQLTAEMATLESAMKRGILTAAQYQEALLRLQTEGLTDEPISVLDTESLVPDSDSVLDNVSNWLDKFEEDAKRKTESVIESFGAMAAGAIGSVRDMVQTFKSGDILGGIQQFLELVLNVVRALGQIGIIKLPTGGTPTPRAHGGPVVPGRSYLVGEKGPEIVTFGAKGYVSPNRSNNQPIKVQIIPSPYFDAVVDNRSRNVAAPMAGQAAVMGMAGAEARRNRQMRRSIP